MKNIEKIIFEITDKYTSNDIVEIDYLDENGQIIDDDSLCDLEELNILTDNEDIQMDDFIKPIYVGITTKGKKLLFETSAKDIDRKYLKGYTIIDEKLTEIEKLKRLKSKIESDEKILKNMGFEVQKRR